MGTELDRDRVRWAELPESKMVVSAIGWRSR